MGGLETKLPHSHRCYLGVVVAGRLGYVAQQLLLRLVWHYDKVASANYGERAPLLAETAARLKRKLRRIIEAGNARERLRRTTLIVAWTVQGVLRPEDAAEVAAYEARTALRCAGM